MAFPDDSRAVPPSRQQRSCCHHDALFSTSAQQLASVTLKTATASPCARAGAHKRAFERTVRTRRRCTQRSHAEELASANHNLNEQRRWVVVRWPAEGQTGPVLQAGSIVVRTPSAVSRRVVALRQARRPTLCSRRESEWSVSPAKQVNTTYTHVASENSKNPDRPRARARRSKQRTAPKNTCHCAEASASSSRARVHCFNKRGSC